MRSHVKFSTFILALTSIMTVSGVYATWKFSEGPAFNDSSEFDVGLNEFTFGPSETLHITNTQLFPLTMQTT